MIHPGPTNVIVEKIIMMMLMTSMTIHPGATNVIVVKYIDDEDPLTLLMIIMVMLMTMMMLMLMMMMMKIMTRTAMQMMPSGQAAVFPPPFSLKLSSVTNTSERYLNIVMRILFDCYCYCYFCHHMMLKPGRSYP